MKDSRHFKVSAGIPALFIACIIMFNIIANKVEANEFVTGALIGLVTGVTQQSLSDDLCHAKIRNYQPVTLHCEGEMWINYDFPGNGSSKTRWEHFKGRVTK